jgi:hypothetical protein
MARFGQLGGRLGLAGGNLQRRHPLLAVDQVAGGAIALAALQLPALRFGLGAFATGSFDGSLCLLGGPAGLFDGADELPGGAAGPPPAGLRLLHRHGPPQQDRAGVPAVGGQELAEGERGALGALDLLGRDRVDPRLLLSVALGFVGVALILRPTIEQNQLWDGLVGLLSGMISATAYLQVTALGRVGEPDYRIVFYFSLGSMAAGIVLGIGVGWHAHTVIGLALLLAVGVLGTVAQTLMTRAYSIGRPLVNASLQYLGIAFSFILGVLLFDDHLTWLAVLGMLLIVAAGIGATRFRSAVARTATPSQEVSP